MKLGFPELIIVLLIVGFALLTVGRIFEKAGYSRWLGLTVMVPLLNIAVLVWFAYSDWPALRRP
jgi:hypothetical protein